jgi:hypothetical protein
LKLAERERVVWENMTETLIPDTTGSITPPHADVLLNQELPASFSQPVGEIIKSAGAIATPQGLSSLYNEITSLGEKTSIVEKEYQVLRTMFADQLTIAMHLSDDSPVFPYLGVVPTDTMRVSYHIAEIDGRESGITISPNKLEPGKNHTLILTEEGKVILISDEPNGKRTVSAQFHDGKPKTIADEKWIQDPSNKIEHVTHTYDIDGTITTGIALRGGTMAQEQEKKNWPADESLLDLYPKKEAQKTA